MLDIFILEDNITQQFRIERQIETIMERNHWEYQRLEAFAASKDIIKKADGQGN